MEKRKGLIGLATACFALSLFGAVLFGALGANGPKTARANAATFETAQAVSVAGASVTAGADKSGGVTHQGLLIKPQEEKGSYYGNLNAVLPANSKIEFTFPGSLHGNSSSMWIDFTFRFTSVATNEWFEVYTVMINGNWWNSMMVRDMEGHARTTWKWGGGWFETAQADGYMLPQYGGSDLKSGYLQTFYSGGVLSVNCFTTSEGERNLILAQFDSDAYSAIDNDNQICGLKKMDFSQGYTVSFRANSSGNEPTAPLLIESINGQSFASATWDSEPAWYTDYRAADLARYDMSEAVSVTGASVTAGADQSGSVTHQGLLIEPTTPTGSYYGNLNAVLPASSKIEFNFPGTLLEGGGHRAIDFTFRFTSVATNEWFKVVYTYDGVWFNNVRIYDMDGNLRTQSHAGGGYSDSEIGAVYYPFYGGNNSDTGYIETEYTDGKLAVYMLSFNHTKMPVAYFDSDEYTAISGGVCGLKKIDFSQGYTVMFSAQSANGAETAPLLIEKINGVSMAGTSALDMNFQKTEYVSGESVRVETTGEAKTAQQLGLGVRYYYTATVGSLTFTGNRVIYPSVEGLDLTKDNTAIVTASFLNRPVNQTVNIFVLYTATATLGESTLGEVTYTSDADLAAKREELNGLLPQSGREYTYAWADALPDPLPLADATYAAVKTPVDYTVTFANAEGVEAITFNVENMPASFPDVPAKKGYTPFGWDKTPKEIALEDTVVTAKYLVGRVYGGSASLKGDIVMNFYLELSDETLSDPEAVAEFTFGGTTAKTVSLSEGVQNGAYYAYSFPVAAKEYAEEITLTIRSGEGAGVSATTSVKAYAETVASGDYSAEVKTLIQSLCDYCEAAKTYFAGGEATEDKFPSVTQEILKDYAAVVEGTAPEGVTVVGASLVLESRTAIRFYFTVADVAAVSVTVDGVEAQVQSLVQGEKTYYYVEIADIAAKDLSAAHTVEIGSYTVTYSALSYVEQNVSSTNVAYANVLKATYLYNVAASEYFGASAQ